MSVTTKKQLIMNRRMLNLHDDVGVCNDYICSFYVEYFFTLLYVTVYKEEFFKFFKFMLPF